MARTTEAILALLLALSLSAISIEPLPPDAGSFAVRLHQLGMEEDAATEWLRERDDSNNNNSYYLGWINYSRSNLNQSIKSWRSIIDKEDIYPHKERCFSLISKAELAAGDVETALKFYERARDGGFQMLSAEDAELLKSCAAGRWGEHGIEKPKSRSPGLARGMSLILPGSGMAYAGKPGMGLRSLALNAASGYLVGQGFAAGYYPRAMTIFYFIGGRYWLGGSAAAAELAEDFNRSEKMKAAAELEGRLNWLAE